MASSNHSDCIYSEYPAIYPSVIISVKVVTNVCCCVSIAAACWIILTYFLFKDLRTTARQLLVNLSIADILIAGSHLVGTMVNYERFIPYYNGNKTNISQYDALCVSQAAVTVYSSISSFLWTMSIAVYMLFLTLSVQRKVLRVTVVFIYVISWGIPIPFVTFSAAKRYLGFQYTGSTACYTVDDDDNPDAVLIASEILSYEIWVYLAYLLLPIVYLTLLCYIRCKKGSHASMLAATKTDIKLLLVPISFLFLRIWTTVDDAIAFYTDTLDKEFRCSTANAVLLFFQIIGVNSQGTVNAILFCLLTKPVRRRWYLTVKRLCRCGQQRDNEETELLDETVELGSPDNRVVSSYGTINAKTA